MATRSAILVLLALTACGEPHGDPEPVAIDTTPRVSVEPPTVNDTGGPPRLASAEPLDDVLLADAVPVPEPAPESAPDEVAPEAIDEAPTATFALRYGETLAHFARWSELPVEDIAEASGLDLDGTYAPGTEVVVPVAGVDVARLESLREEHMTRRVDGYLASRGGAQGTDFHRVRTGDSAWTIARNHHGIPLWLLAAYNPEVSLDALRPGQELMVPVLADVVADAE